MIDKWSPKVIGYFENPNHKKIEKELTKVCLSVHKNTKSGGKNWVSSKTFNTLQTHNLHTDKRFHDLNIWVFDKLREYSNYMKYKNDYKCDTSWMSVYKKYDYQEFHTHSLNSLSAVYFLKSNPKKSSKIIFKVSEDPFINEPTPTEYNQDNSSVALYEAVPGRLLIFKSNLPHCVERSEENNTRISLAYNFNIV